MVIPLLERRAKHRAKIALPAVAVFPKTGEDDCIVINISTRGACIAFAPGTEVPRMFELKIGPDPALHTVRVIWRRQNMVGVGFIVPRNAPDVFEG